MEAVNMLYYSQYRGVYYRFVPASTLTENKEQWHLAESPDGIGIVAFYNADKMRIDQCFDDFNKLKIRDEKHRNALYPVSYRDCIEPMPN